MKYLCLAYGDEQKIMAQVLDHWTQREAHGRWRPCPTSIDELEDAS